MQKSPFIEIDGELININKISRIHEYDYSHTVIIMESEKIIVADSFYNIKEVINIYYKNN